VRLEKRPVLCRARRGWTCGSKCAGFAFSARVVAAFSLLVKAGGAASWSGPTSHSSNLCLCLCSLVSAAFVCFWLGYLMLAL